MAGSLRTFVPLASKVSSQAQCCQEVSIRACGSAPLALCPPDAAATAAARIAPSCRPTAAAVADAGCCQNRAPARSTRRVAQCGKQSSIVQGSVQTVAVPSRQAFYCQGRTLLQHNERRFALAILLIRPHNVGLQSTGKLSGGWDMQPGWPGDALGAAQVAVRAVKLQTLIMLTTAPHNRRGWLMIPNPWLSRRTLSQPSAIARRLDAARASRRRTGTHCRATLVPPAAGVPPVSLLRARHAAAGARRQAVHQLLHVLPRVRQRVGACVSARLLLSVLSPSGTAACRLAVSHRHGRSMCVQGNMT